MRRWHWISSALCLSALLLFAVTGFLLNHADVLEPPAVAASRSLQLPQPALASLASGPAQGAATLPPPVADFLGRELDLRAGGLKAEWSAEEVSLSVPRPGRERTVTLDRFSGAVTDETSSRGVVGLLNDLHTGRNSGKAWSLFIDVFALGCLVFATTGLILASLYAAGRPATWPLLAAGAAAPLILVMLLLLHIV